MVESEGQSMVRSRANTFGGRQCCIVLGFDVFSAKEPCIDRPRTGPDHRCSCAESSHYYWNPGIPDVSYGDPQLDYCDQTSHDRRPEADEEQDANARTHDLRDHRWRKRCACELHDPEANQQDSG